MSLLARSSRTLMLLAAACLTAAPACKDDASAPAPKTQEAPVQTVTPSPTVAPKAPAAPRTPQPPRSPESIGRVSAAGISFAVPKGWSRVSAQGAMRIAQFELQKVGEDKANGTVTVIAAGGSVDANVERWIKQFQGQPDIVKRTLKAGDREMLEVILSGNYVFKARPMAPGPGDVLPDYAVHAVLIPAAKERHVFVKSWGPRATMAHWEKSFAELAASVKADE